MSHSVEAPGGETRQAFSAGVVCYLIWGLLPGLFILTGRAGVSPWEILGQRALWSAPWAAALVLMSGHLGQVRRALTTPKTLGLLALSALMIASGWSVYVWAVNNGHNLESSLGYFINPLFNMAVGAVFFRERIGRLGLVAIGLAATGVVLQTLALGRPPIISLFLASTFCAYGIIRKRVDVDAQAGLLVETLLMAGPALAYVLWLGHSGAAAFGRLPTATWLLLLTGPATVIPLALFSWTARRLPLSTVAFLQFIGPTLGFITGLVVGERLNPLGVVSFAFIWAGVATFVIGALRASRRLELAPA
jgi:chloramphenicol-sensitive protein RarD